MSNNKRSIPELIHEFLNAKTQDDRTALAFEVLAANARLQARIIELQQMLIAPPVVRIPTSGLVRTGDPSWPLLEVAALDNKAEEV